MRRGPIVLTATAAVAAALVSFHPSHHAASAGAAKAVTAAGSGSSQSGTRTITGAVEQTSYGPVQVKVSVRRGRITDVQAVQVPQAEPRSQQIADYATPLLRQETLTAQNAAIDAVSGATYTSKGYEASLQSALNRAGI